MGGYKLRDYQEGANRDLLPLLVKHKKVVAVAGTGAGKTVMMTRLISDALPKTKGKIAVFVDSIDLVKQTSEAFQKQGIQHQRITAKTKVIYDDFQVYIVMVQTYLSRIKKTPDYLPGVTFCVVDECHIKTYNQLMEVYPEAYFLGYTATPVYMGKKESMSDYYNYCHVIKDVPDLIDMGALNPEKAYVTQLGANDLDKLKKSSTGDFTGSSLDLVFNSERIIDLTYAQWDERCRGIKTVIYASSIEHCKALTEYFTARGVNCRSQDSKNNSDAQRTGTVQWFREAKGEAVLINVATFVKGFDVPDIGAIILAFSTLSLSKFVQVCGRGGRLAEGKDSFILIDLGNNILKSNGKVNHGLWSDARDWKSLFEGKRAPATWKVPRPCAFVILAGLSIQ